MFRRREDEINDADSSTQGSLLGSETVKVINNESSSYTPPSQPAATSPLSSTYPAAPRTAPEAPRPAAPAAPTSFRPAAPAPDMSRPRAPETKPAPSFSTPITSSSSRDSRRVLTVGSDILLKGEIATCDRLVIEGKVDAILNDVGTVELAESGSFKGVAQVENAEISGLFEGELVVKGRLVIYASGRVRGKVTYGEIEIERGGELTGEIKTMTSASTARTATRTLKEEKEKTAA